MGTSTKSHHGSVETKSKSKNITNQYTFWSKYVTFTLKSQTKQNKKWASIVQLESYMPADVRMHEKEKNWINGGFENIMGTIKFEIEWNRWGLRKG